MVNIRIATARIAHGRDARLLKLGRRTAPPGVPDGHEDSESIGRHRVNYIGRINGDIGIGFRWKDRDKLESIDADAAVTGNAATADEHGVIGQGAGLHIVRAKSWGA